MLKKNLLSENYTNLQQLQGDGKWVSINRAKENKVFK